MPNFLSDVGRSNALPGALTSTVNLLGGLDQMRSNTQERALALREYNQKEQINEQTIAMNKSNLRKVQLEAEDDVKKRKREAELVILEDVFASFPEPLMPATIAYLTNLHKLEGVLEPDPNVPNRNWITRGDLKAIQPTIYGNIKNFEEMYKIEYNTLTAAETKQDQMIDTYAATFKEEEKLRNDKKYQSMVKAKTDLHERAIVTKNYVNAFEIESLRQETEAKNVAKETEPPYKVGQFIEREEGGEKVTYQVTGYGENNLPILAKQATTPKYQPEKPEEIGQKYTRWENTVDGRIKQLFQGYGLTDAETNSAVAGDYASAIAGLTSGKKLSPEGANKLNADLKKLTQIRDKGLTLIRQGKDPYSAFGIQEYTEVPDEEVVGKLAPSHEAEKPITAPSGEPIKPIGTTTSTKTVAPSISPEATQRIESMGDKLKSQNVPEEEILRRVREEVSKEEKKWESVTSSQKQTKSETDAKNIIRDKIRSGVSLDSHIKAIEKMVGRQFTQGESTAMKRMWDEVAGKEAKKPTAATRGPAMPTPLKEVPALVPKVPPKETPVLVSTPNKEILPKERRDEIVSMLKERINEGIPGSDLVQLWLNPPTEEIASYIESLKKAGITYTLWKEMVTDAYFQAK